MGIGQQHTGGTGGAGDQRGFPQLHAQDVVGVPTDGLEDADVAPLLRRQAAGLVEGQDGKGQHGTRQQRQQQAFAPAEHGLVGAAHVVARDHAVLAQRDAGLLRHLGHFAGVAHTQHDVGVLVFGQLEEAAEVGLGQQHQVCADQRRAGRQHGLYLQVEEDTAGRNQEQRRSRRKPAQPRHALAHHGLANGEYRRRARLRHLQGVVGAAGAVEQIAPQPALRGLGTAQAAQAFDVGGTAHLVATHAQALQHHVGRVLQHEGGFSAQGAGQHHHRGQHEDQQGVHQQQAGMTRALAAQPGHGKVHQVALTRQPACHGATARRAQSPRPAPAAPGPPACRLESAPAPPARPERRCADRPGSGGACSAPR